MRAYEAFVNWPEETRRAIIAKIEGGREGRGGRGGYQASGKGTPSAQGNG
ncbi:MAG: hypothetical protein QW057_06440 [Candidatus Bathyarchaeia archaeon]